MWIKMVGIKTKFCEISWKCICALEFFSRIIKTNKPDLSKYKDLEIEIQKMWHLKIQINLIGVGILKIIKNYVSHLPGELSLAEILKDYTWVLPISFEKFYQCDKLWT